MDTTTETKETVRQAWDGLSDQPRPEWVRGVCPSCGGPVVANCYYVGGRRYIVIHECWNALGTDPTCSYRRIL